MFRIRNHLPLGLVLLLVSSGAGAEQDASSVTLNDLYQPDDAYAETQRASVNLIWSPMAPLDIGVESLWGSRENKDGSKGTANQLQIAATFNFSGGPKLVGQVLPCLPAPPPY